MKQDKFLLVKGISGLGDRIKCVLTAILYARLTGRKLIVDWTDSSYSNAGTFSVPYVIQRMKFLQPIL
jgi:hypothetical protein